MGQRELIRIIRSFQYRLNIADVIQKSIMALYVGAGVGILFQAAAFVVPFYDAALYSVLALLVALLTAILTAFVKRTSMRQTALVMDRFGFEERIVTAYENIGQEGALIEHQRDDAMSQLSLYRDRIRIPLFPSWKKMVLLLVLLSVMPVLALLPSAVKERAKELHAVRQEAREKTKEIEELVDSLEEFAQQDLSQEHKATLQEMIERLESSQMECEQTVSSEQLTAASNKLEYKYGTMGSELAALAQQLQNGASVSTMTPESMQALAEKMQTMGGMELADGDSMQSGSNQNGQSGNGSQNGQNGGQDGAGSLNGQNGDGGQDGHSGAGGQNGQNGDGSKDGQNGDGGQDGQSGAGGQNGQNGDKSQGGQQGDGRGTGSSNTPHDYVSIPNDIADTENLTGNAVNHEDSTYFRAQNGLSWEGVHMSHEAVLGSYEQKAYEGIAAGRYPSGMEEVIKQYFSSFNQ